MSFLRHSLGFATMPQADRETLERLFVLDTVAAGHVFFREGDQAVAVTACMYVLVEGAVHVSAAVPDAGIGIERNLVPGQVFGALALVADVPRTATCTAVGRVKVARLDRRTFDELFRRDLPLHVRFQLVIAKQIAGDLRHLSRWLAEAVDPRP